MTSSPSGFQWDDAGIGAARICRSRSGMRCWRALDGSADRPACAFDVVAIAPYPIELWLLKAMLGDELEELEEGLATGILVSEGRTVGFRYDLARLAVEESISTLRAVPDEAIRLPGSPWTARPRCFEGGDLQRTGPVAVARGRELWRRRRLRRRDRDLALASRAD